MAHWLYPRGPGASNGPVPAGSVEVHRWADLTEVNAWMHSGGTIIPAGIGAGGRVYVTLPGAPKPPGTGRCRIEFFIASRALQVAGHTQWRQVLQPIQNVPLYNVKILVP